jgi:hypothetical protein
MPRSVSGACDLGDEERVGDIHVFASLEPRGIGVGMIAHNEDDVVSEGLTGVVIPAIEADGVVHGGSGVTPAQEVLGELLRDEAQLEEQPDGAPAPALGQVSPRNAAALRMSGG